MSGASDHHEKDWEFGFIVKAVELIQIVSIDIAFSVGIISPGGIRGVVVSFAVKGLSMMLR
jgi:hypothetical protein